MVERLEGFCSENDWMRAYNEINEFEKELHDWGAVIIKFWVQIDKDTQLAQVEKNNKAAGTRARKSALEISKLMKEFRKVSVEAAK